MKLKHSLLIIATLVLSTTIVSGIDITKVDQTIHESEKIECDTKSNCLLSDVRQGNTLYEWDDNEEILRNRGNAYGHTLGVGCAYSTSKGNLDDYSGAFFSQATGSNTEEYVSRYLKGQTNRTDVIAEDVFSGNSGSQQFHFCTNPQDDEMIALGTGNQAFAWWENTKTNSSFTTFEIGNNNKTVDDRNQYDHFFGGGLSWIDQTLYYTDNETVKFMTEPYNTVTEFSANFKQPKIDFTEDSDGNTFGFVVEDDNTSSDIYYYNGNIFNQIGTVSNDLVDVRVVNDNPRVAISITDKGNILQLRNTSINSIGNLNDNVTSFDCPSNDKCFAINNQSVYRITDLGLDTQADELKTSDFTGNKQDGEFTPITQGWDMTLDQSRNVYMVGDNPQQENQGLLISAGYDFDNVFNIQTLDSFNQSIYAVDWKNFNGKNELVIGGEDSAFIYTNATSPSKVEQDTPVELTLLAPYQDIEIFDRQNNLTVVVGCGSSLTANLTVDENELISFEYNHSSNAVTGTAQGDDCRSLDVDESAMVYVNTGNSADNGFRTYTYNYSLQTLERFEKFNVRSSEYLGEYQGANVITQPSRENTVIASNGKIDIFNQFGSGEPQLTNFLQECDTGLDKPTNAISWIKGDNFEGTLFEVEGDTYMCRFGSSGTSLMVSGQESNTGVQYENIIFQTDKWLEFTKQGQLNLYNISLTQEAKEEQEQADQPSGIPTGTNIKEIVDDLRNLAGFGGTTGAVLISLIFIGSITYGGFRLTENMGGGIVGLFMSTIFFYYLEWLPLIAMILLCIVGAFMIVKMIEQMFFSSTM